MATEIINGFPSQPITDPSRWQNPAMPTAGKDVFRRRKRVRWSQAALARHAGVDKETVGRIEHDDETVKATTLQIVLDALSEKERDLLGHGVQASSLPTEGASRHVDSSRILTVDRAAISELKALATRILVIAGSLDDAAERGRGADPQPHHLHSAATPKKR